MDGAPVRGKGIWQAYINQTLESILELSVKWWHFMVPSLARFPYRWLLPEIMRHFFLFIPGESIPIRLFLSGYELTPTMRDINKKFSVRYYLNLVLVDEEERRYFKQQVWAEVKLNVLLKYCWANDLQRSANFVT